MMCGEQMFLAGILALSTLAESAGGAPLDPAELSERYRAWCAQTRSYTASYRTEETHQGDPWNSGVDKAAYLVKGDLASDDTRVNYENSMFKSEAPVAWEDAQWDRADKLRELFDGKTWFRYLVDSNPEGGGKIGDSSDAHPVLRTILLDTKPERPKENLWNPPDAFLRGRYFGNVSSLEELMAATPDIESLGIEEVEGSTCHRVRFDSPEGEHTVWFDEDHGFMVKMAEIRKTGEDLNGRITVDRLTRGRPGFVLWYQMKVDDFQKVGEVWLAKDAQWWHQTWDGSGQLVEEDISRLVYTRVDLAPDFDQLGVFVPDFPDHTRVRRVGWQGRSFEEWNDMKVTYQVDKRLVKGIEEEAGRLSPPPELAESAEAIAPLADAANTAAPPAPSPPEAPPPARGRYLFWAAPGALLLAALAWGGLKWMRA